MLQLWKDTVLKQIALEKSASQKTLIMERKLQEVCSILKLAMKKCQKSC